MLAAIGLPGDGVIGQVEAGHGQRLQLFGAHVAAVKQFHEARLGADRAFQPLAAQIGDQRRHLPLVFQQVLGVDRQAKAERRRFGRLDVGVGHDGQAGRLLDAPGEDQQQPA